MAPKAVAAGVVFAGRAALCVAAAFALGPVPAAAAPAPPQSGGWSTMRVYSAAMGRPVELQVLRAADPAVPAPVLYLLNGADGGVVGDASTWQNSTDITSFFAGRQVNVVTVVGGAYSYYTDWLRPDPVLGVNEWSTFLTRELPPVMNSALGASGRNAIAGLSMSATSVLSLAEHSHTLGPGAGPLYQAVGAYSGCAQTSTAPGVDYVRMVVRGRGGGDVQNMWGPIGGPDWIAHDPARNAENLRGTALYVASGSGLPGPHDTLADPDVHGSPGALANQVGGGVLEAAVDQCNHALAQELRDIHIPATFDFTPTGTHSWGYWQDDLHKSWPMIAAATGTGR
ncbi:alpha/beta hydrolase [Speluncibacter jeojiensis]|uniref:alpha/beta hydrolase n=1 Tax=Speluncibacter jeojiensis TaxID=2710754 RepID=UPI00240EB23C|nr:alpha/beta hydrolase family protein [Rhodococcus sp. D2-41]